MVDNSELTSSVPPPGKPLWKRFFSRPSTQLGWWSFVLLAALVVLIAVAYTFSTYFPLGLGTVFLYAISLCELGSVIFALAALIGQYERSWLVWFSILFDLMVLAFFSYLFYINVSSG